MGSPNVPVLAGSLVFPGDSDTYANLNAPEDGVLSVGDWVRGSPGVNNAASVRDALDALNGVVFTVPVWDEATSQGRNRDYHVVGFARVRIAGHRLARQNRVSAVYLGGTTCPER